VITRLPCVVEQDLAHIVSAGRAYVAAEMNAFLMSWLTALKCPLLNRPTPPCLSGPYWRREKWLATAARLGIPITPIHRHATLSGELIPKPNSQPDGITVTIVGQKSIGAVSPLLARQARSLANMAGVDLLSVRFSGPTDGSFFVEANLWPDIAADDVAEAVFSYICKGAP
jgi:hypothetical protein